MPLNKKLTQSHDHNIHGHRAPPGCALTRRPQDPRVAVAQKTLGSYEAALLANDQQLFEILAGIVRESATLKAWFAFRIKSRGKGIVGKKPLWIPVWNLIQEKGAAWVTAYSSSISHATQWELSEPTDRVELWAYTLCVLYCNVKDNPGHDDERIDGFKWHRYYYEPEGKYFLLYKLLHYVVFALDIDRAETLFCPVDPQKVSAWRQSCAGGISLAASRFMRDTRWDPLKLKPPTGSAENREFLESGDGKFVLFILAEHGTRQVFRVRSKHVPQDADDDMTLQDVLATCLGVTEVVVSDGCDNRPITTLDEFLDVVDLAEEPFLWLRPANGGLEETETSALDTRPTTRKRRRHTSNTSAYVDASLSETVEPIYQRDYSRHPILRLKPELERIDDKAQIRYAQPRFSLIRENDRHSADLVAELQQFFADFEQDTYESWRTLSNRMELFDNNTINLTRSDELRNFIAELRGADRTFAEQYLGLVESNNPLAKHATEELIKLLMPDPAEWEDVLRIKGIFDEIQKDGTENGEATIQD